MWKFRKVTSQLRKIQFCNKLLFNLCGKCILIVDLIHILPPVIKRLRLDDITKALLKCVKYIVAAEQRSFVSVAKRRIVANFEPHAFRKWCTHSLVKTPSNMQTQSTKSSASWCKSDRRPRSTKGCTTSISTWRRSLQSCSPTTSTHSPSSQS